MEPEFIAQCADQGVDRRAWFEARANDAAACGATWFRFSIHPDDPDLILCEGWKVRPDNEGPQRFQLPESK